MSGTSSGSSSGITFFGLLTIAFIVLKLSGKFIWSWWWALAPLWIPPAILIFIFIVGALFFIIAQILKK